MIEMAQNSTKPTKRKAEAIIIGFEDDEDVAEVVAPAKNPFAKRPVLRSQRTDNVVAPPKPKLNQSTGGTVSGGRLSAKPNVNNKMLGKSKTILLSSGGGESNKRKDSSVS